MTTEERMKIISDCFTAMCERAGYKFSIKIDPRSRGHKFHIKIFKEDHIVFETTKIRTHPEYEPILGERKQNSKSPDLSDLQNTINSKLKLGGHQLLENPCESDEGYLAWLLFSSHI